MVLYRKQLWFTDHTAVRIQFLGIKAKFSQKKAITFLGLGSCASLMRPQPSRGFVRESFFIQMRQMQINKVYHRKCCFLQQANFGDFGTLF